MSQDAAAGFTDLQVRTLDAVLDALIPPSEDGRLPGAGRLGLAPDIESALRATPDLLAMVAGSLSALDEMARARGGCGFDALSAQDRQQTMGDLESSAHALPPVLIVHTFAAYYRNPAVLAALGLEARPPHPKGYEVPADDFSLLEPVRKRPPLYRKC